VKVEFRKSFEKDLSKLKDQSLLDRIRAVIEEAESAESLLTVKNVKKLESDENYYRVRVGNYRIGLTYEEDTITFV
jgi:mRNA interferase RelE/StbE